jgi:hypothetical protein
LARPTVSCQYQYNLCRDIARPLVDVEPPITKRILATDDRGIVSSHVAEPGGVSMRASVKMHDHAEVGVRHVVVLDTAVVRTSHLPDASWQTVSPLHLSVVPQFEQVVIAGSCIAEGSEQLATPAQLLPAMDQLGKPLRGGEPLSASHAEPVDRVIERTSSLCQVDRSLLESRSGRPQDRMTCPWEPSRDMHSDAGHGPRTAATVWDRHVDQPLRLIGETV